MNVRFDRYECAAESGARFLGGAERGFFDRFVLSETYVADIRTPANLPYGWFRFVGFQTSGPVPTNLVTAVGWRKMFGHLGAIY